MVVLLLQQQQQQSQPSSQQMQIWLMPPQHHHHWIITYWKNPKSFWIISNALPMTNLEGFGNHQPPPPQRQMNQNSHCSHHPLIIVVIRFQVQITNTPHSRFIKSLSLSVFNCSFFARSLFLRLFMFRFIFCTCFHKVNL